MNEGRVFRLWYYTISHGMLVIRSPRDQEFINTIDYIFSDVQYMDCPEKMTGIQITALEKRVINTLEYTKYELRSDEGSYSVVALQMSCAQTMLDAWDVRPYKVGERSLAEEMYCYGVGIPVEGKGKYAKHIGGKGNFAELHIRLEEAKPIPGNVRFEDGVAVPNEYFLSIRSALNKCRDHWPELPVPAAAMDIIVTGGVHLEVDASHFAYRQAAILAWQDAIARAGRLGVLDVFKLGFEGNDAVYQKLEKDQMPTFLEYKNS